MSEKDQLHDGGSMVFDSKLQLKRQSISLKRPPFEDLVNDNQKNSTDDIQIALAPDVQSYLTKIGKRQTCCNVVLPIAFERADPKSWFNPKFDSPALEEQYLISFFPQMRMLYRFSLVYIIICTLGWALYFWIGANDQKDWYVEVLVLIILAAISMMGLWFTNTDTYQGYRHLTSIITSIALCTIGLSFLCFSKDKFSPLGHFALCLEIVILVYCGIPTKICIRPLIAISYSILFETLSSKYQRMIGVHGTDPLYYNKVLTLRIVLQFSVHFMASHLLLMRTIRMRRTFFQMGKNLLLRRQLRMEKQLNENMIHSVMPPKIADMLLNEDGTRDSKENAKHMRPRSLYRVDADFKSFFRPFHIRSMNNVSILFADIVGFTVWSSQKTADEVVEVLNDLFERFDDLCSFSGCEKISTLGDCYFCVSGCPEPRPDHAVCCVEMGMSIIDVMGHYEEQRHEGVKMRVGVHTGTVFFGILGTRMVKFDVWSNDVDLANLMETTGKPEQVHISQATLNYLGHAYLVEEGQEVMGQRTYFVMGRKKRHSLKRIIKQSPRASYPLLDNKNDDTLSTSSINSPVPPNSPVGEMSVHYYTDSSNESSSRPSSIQQIYALNQAAAVCMCTFPENLTIPTSSINSSDTQIQSIENNSRRSSKQQIYALNQAAAVCMRTFSKNFSVPTLSINLGETQIEDRSYIVAPVPETPTMPVANLLAKSLEQLRRQSDVQLIRCVRNNVKSTESYFLNPPLHQCSLFFQSEEIEREFRSEAHRFANEKETGGPPTIATPRYSTYLDILVGTVVYCCVATSLFLLAPHSVTHFETWVVIFFVFTGIQLFALFYFTRQMCRRNSDNDKTTKKSYGDRIFAAISSWYPWHICFAILLSMPVVLVIIYYALLDLHLLQANEYHYGFLIFVCVVQFCNFTQLNFWMRNILALLAAIGFILICYTQMTDDVHKNKFLKEMNQTILSEAQKNLLADVEWYEKYYFEIYLDILLLVVLVWLLNRELEIGYRLSFYSNAVAKHDKIKELNMKNQADVLLHNIMPKHVAEHLKNTAEYSNHHRNIAVIFASIVNLGKFYKEGCVGGKEHLRVLNEVIGDFDEQLSRAEFMCVEKIKTIGSTFMAASGLNPQHRCVKNHHIAALMEFSKSLLLAINSFNKDRMEFELILRIGFNVGDITAGVIGTSKLHYDIWGDAVNVASRMNTTGVSSRIQVGKDCLPYLEDWYEFESRGEVYVKGKGNMEVFLYKTDRPYSAQDDCENECGFKPFLNRL